MATTEMVQVAQLNEPKSTQGVFTLPCGYIDGTGTLHTEVEVREITGNEEDMFVSSAIPDSKKLSELIYRCTTRIGTVTDRGQLSQVCKELPVGDRVFLMFAIRRATFGDSYPFEDECPECKKKRLYEINLKDLDMKEMTDKTKRIFEAVLSNGKKVEFRTLLGLDEEKLSKFQKKDDALSQMMLTRITAYNGLPVTLDVLKGLSMKLRQEIRELFDQVDGGVDTTLEMECPDCGAEFERDIDVSQPGFFFPSQVRKTSKRKSSA